MLFSTVFSCFRKHYVYWSDFSMTKEQTKSSSRIHILDALRGFALLGILLAHMSHWFAAGPLPTDIHKVASDAATISGGQLSVALIIKKILEFTSAAFVNGKFYPLFTFIFGFSFALMEKSFLRDDRNPDALFARRAVCLLLIGFVHQLVWMGDILMIYAILMFPLMLLRKLNNKSLLAIGLLLVLNVPGIAISIEQVSSHTRPTSEVTNQAEIFVKAFSRGGWLEMMAFDLNNLAGKLNFQLMSGRFFSTLGFFLLGLLTARKGWLNFIDGLNKRLYPIFIASYVLMASLQLLLLLLNYPDIPDHASQIIIGNVITSLQGLAAVVTFTSFVAILHHTDRLHKLFQPLSNLGRAALSNYLLQTAFGLLLFCYEGFGLFGRTSHIVNVGIGFAFFGFQMVLTNWWFRHFNYGPIEWLLRGATYGELQPLKKTATA